MGVISHILHPHSMLKPLELKEPLGGLLLISPWISMSYTSKSYQSNALRDVLHASSLQRWESAWRGKAPVDAYIDAGSAPSGWWTDLGSSVRKVMITAGESELFRDDIIYLSQAIEKNHDQVQCLVARNETHDQAIIDLDFGFAEHGESARTIIQLIETLVTSN